MFLLGFSLLLCLALFLIADWLRTNRILQSPSGRDLSNGCETSDPIREHALKRNCSSTAHWGKEAYPFFTDNLGFRDSVVRVVPESVPQPRVLVLGDSYTEGMCKWDDTYVGMLASRFVQYDFLNGGITSYSPSNYLNTARMVLRKGIQFDEVIVFIDISDVQDEAAFYHDVDDSGAVTGPPKQPWVFGRYEWVRAFIAHRLLLTNALLEFIQGGLVKLGYYHLTLGLFGNTLDMDRSAWTYRPVNEQEGFYPTGRGYGPLGVKGGIQKEIRKMDELQRELAAHNVPLSVVVYPQPPQLAHDKVDSWEVRIWRDWCEGKCKRFISLFPAFFAAKNECPWYARGCWYDMYFIFGDLHYNAAGNAVVADVVGRNLDRLPVLKVSDSANAPATSGAAHSPTLPARR
jgi:hypothetical protein